MALITTNSNFPTDKVLAGGIAGAVTTLVVGIAAIFGVEIDPTLVAAAVFVISSVAAYFRKETNPAQKTIDTGASTPAN